MPDKIVNMFDDLLEFFDAICKVPKWRLAIALTFLGNRVVKALAKLGEV